MSLNGHIRLRTAAMGLSAGALVGLLAIGLAACGSFTSPDDVASPQGGLSPVNVGYVTLPDGRELLCVDGDTGDYAGGLSCDWEAIQP